MHVPTHVHTQVHEMIQAKVWALAFAILVLSGLWPYVKSVLMLFLLFVPTRVMADRRKEVHTDVLRCAHMSKHRSQQMSKHR